MKIEYDQLADAMYIRLREGDSVESEEIQENMILDFDAEGHVLGIEIINASGHTNISEMIFATVNQKQAA